MSETRKIAAILAADVVGFSRLTGSDEDRTLARLRALRSDLVDPTIAVHNGHVFKRTGDGILIEFRSVVDAVRCAIEMQNGMIERNVGLPPERRIEFRVGIHLGDVVEEDDGDLMGDGVNIAARLEGIAKPGGICLSEQAYWQVKGRPEMAATDLGPTRLKNIADPVRVYALEIGEPALPQPAKRSAATRLAVLFVAGVAALVVVTAGAWHLFGADKPATMVERAALSQAAHLSIVVLPFTNLSNDPSQDYFADGVTENLTTDLSRIRNSFVIARNTAFTFKGKNVDAKEIGKELGVRYVLEGSVQRDQNRVRVNAQLVDAESGAHLWAERFEEDVADLFKLQDQVVARLANTLGIELVKAEARKSDPSKSPDSVDLVMRGMAFMQQSPPTMDKMNAARASFDQALQIDRNDADALAGEANTYFIEFTRWRNSGTDYDAKILGQADRAIALAPDSLWSYFAKSVYLYNSHRPDKALDAANAGLAINPNFAPLRSARSRAEAFLGNFAESKTDIQQALRLSPRDPFGGAWHWYLGDAEFGLGHVDAAIDEYHKSLDAGYRTYFAYESLAAAYAVAGKMEEAKAALAEAQRLQTPLVVKWWILQMPNIPALVAGLRKAGLPEECDPRSRTGWDQRPCEPAPVATNMAAPAEAAHLSIVVLPFTNLSNDPSQDYFADGVTENLTTDLSRIRNSFVIARNTAFTFKGKNVDAKEIGKELGVRYVLEGSVQRDENRVRVNAQLVDAESGAHLWAERFEEDVADLFKLQDQVVARLGNALGFELVKAEAEKGARSKNPDAVDLAMRGWAMMWQSYPQPMKEKEVSHNAALALFDQALKIDPNDADALAGDAFTHMVFYVYGWATAEKDFDAKIIDQADRAIALAPDNMRAYAAKSFYLAVSHRANEALRAADAGLAINPNYAPLLDARANAETALGRFEQAKSDGEQAMRLSPRDPEMANRLMNLGTAELGLGHFEAAIVEFQKAIDAGDRSFIPYTNLAAAYSLEGKTGEAKSALAEGRRLNPKLTIKWLMDHAPNILPLFEGLRKAGLPEE
jgi:adenylate cyclase